jgi:hypothetical protein
LFLHIPTAPASTTALFDYDLGSGNYYRASLGADRHVRLAFNLSGYGSTVVADLGAVPTGTWTWISCGFSTAGGLHIRGDLTPLGSGTTTTSVLASSGSNTGTTITGVPFGVGTAVSSTNSDFPNNAGAGWLMACLIQDQISADTAAGNPAPMPTTELAANVDFREYLAHDALGAATLLTDSGTAAIDLPAGPQGLTISDQGPPLLPGSPGPGGAHEGDLSVYQGGQWVTLHIGTQGQELVVVGGEPVWANEAIATTSALGSVIVGSGLSVAGDGTISVASGTGLPSGSEGDILVYKSGSWQRVARGANGQALLSNGTDPGWNDVTNAGTRWEPLTNPSAPDLIYDSLGNVIMVSVSP